MIPVARDRQESMSLPAVCRANAYDLPARIDRGCEQQRQPRVVVTNKGFELDGFVVLPYDRA